MVKRKKKNKRKGKEKEQKKKKEKTFDKLAFACDYLCVSILWYGSVVLALLAGRKEGGNANLVCIYVFL